MIPKNITEQDVKLAIEDIETNGIKYPLAKSKKFDLVFNGKTYPPKYIISIANEFANKKYLEHRTFNTYEAQSYLKNLSPNFTIQEKRDADPVLELIEKYKHHIRTSYLKDEIYKWELLEKFKGRPNLLAPDFLAEIKSIDYSNLIYPVGITVIRHLSKDRGEPYRECFKVLFDESKDLLDRLKYFNQETLKIYREINTDEKQSHHQDERTMATFLTYYNPDKYTLFKDSFYQKYCKLIDVPSRKKGEKYVHYLELIDEFITEYINEDKELTGLVDGLIPHDAFQDKNHRLLAQDILYQTLDKGSVSNRKYWRIGTGDDKNSLWESMRLNNNACIGWGRIGNLSEKSIKSKKDIELLLTNEKYFLGDKRSLSRKAGEIFNFYENIKVGDVVLAQRGSGILGIGIVTDGYSYGDIGEFANQIGVEWEIESPKLKNGDGNNTTVSMLSNPILIRQVNALLEDTAEKINDINEMRNLNKILNQILFGPPGTGKTFTTVNKALEILDENDIPGERSDVKKLFDAKMKEGKILFTTFHQSMSYEDFIEGIKPIEPKKEAQTINYKIEDGIFKMACALAAYNCYKLFKKNRPAPGKYSFDDLYDAFIDFIQEQIAKDTHPVYKALKGKDIEVKEINSNNSIIARAKNSIAKRSAPLTKENLQKLYDKFKTIEEIRDLKQIRETVEISPRITEFYAIFSGLKQFEKTFNPDEQLIIENEEEEELDPLEIQKKFNGGVFRDAILEFGLKADPVVLIIDEINRGNVSQIFGELITLIEEDKRLGRDEALEVILPYSKKIFGVPPNLYIVGTMNTADRSVEALDAALRRRFSFEEIYPMPTLIATHGKLKATNGVLGTIDLPFLLNTINFRIEKLLDKDHQIGHSYLMTVNSLLDLKAVFQSKIVPLLQEYFFGDYGKIGLIMGSGFFEPIKTEKVNVFADFDDYDTSEFLERTIYKIKNAAKMSDDEFTKAIDILLKK